MTRILVFLIVFVLNLVPAFAPPTWMAMSYLGLANPMSNPLEWGLIGAAAATFGRILLAKLARVLIRHKFLSESTRENVDFIRQIIEKRQRLTSLVFLFYAFSPLPSNQVFISYGLTSLPLRLIAVPFFLGRVVSYSFWAFTASTAARKMDFDISEVGPYFGAYFVISQMILILLIFLFPKIDWRALLSGRRLQWYKAKGRDR